MGAKIAPYHRQTALLAYRDSNSRPIHALVRIY